MEYDKADRSYRAAHSETRDPQMILRMGLCYRASDRPKLAVPYYRAFLNNPVPASDRLWVEGELAALERMP